MKQHFIGLKAFHIPYVFHPFHLAEQLNKENEICVALLHDVVEDTPYTLEDIKKEGFTDEIVDAVACLTREETMDYMDYIRRVKTNPLAVRIKLLDLEHNSDPARIDNEELRQKLHAKYKKAKEELLKR